MELVLQGQTKIPAPIKPHIKTYDHLHEVVTNDQETAVNTVVRAMTGQRKRPAVLTADRGRGKSAALGMAIAKLLTTGLVKRVAVVGGHAQSLDTLFKHLCAGLRIPVPDSVTLYYQSNVVEPISIDALLARANDFDFVVVDEAATIGLPRLTTLLQCHSRIAFATTVQGYEGSGRGFHLKFEQHLKQDCRGPRFQKLEEPIRWRKDDALEDLCDRLLLLKALPREVPIIANPIIETTQLSQQELLNDESTLEQVMALLVSAHYQTKPDNLQHLLDGPNIRLFVQRYDGKICGVLWVCLEGSLEEHIAQDICFGRRRPRGHLVPEVLAAHLGLTQGAQSKIARVQRIAVQANLRRSGLGSQLLKYAEGELKDTTDLFASSFGADAEVLSFWQKSKYQLVRVSDSKNTSSGQHSALVLKAFSTKGAHVLAQARALFSEQLIAQLATTLRDFQWSDLKTLLKDFPHTENQQQLSQRYKRDLNYFASGSRPYESTVVALAAAALTVICQDHELLIRKALQQQSWSTLAKQLGLSGRKEIENQLRDSVTAILEAADETSG